MDPEVRGGLEGHIRRQSLPDLIVVDETKMMEGKRECYLWIAFDPFTRAVVFASVMEVRNILVAIGFFQAIRREYGRLPRKVVTDRGVWYPWALRRLGIEHEVVCGGIRSCVERFNETLKDRARSFDKYFPCDLRCDLSHVIH